MTFNEIVSAMPSLFKGALLTLALTLTSIVIGMFLGLFLALFRISKNKVLNKIAWVYIWIFRGTPLLMQIFFIDFALPLIIPAFSDVSQFVAGMTALGLNSGAYLAEIIRAAIQSIDKGQMEAAKALGMSYRQAMFRIIVPQSYRRLIPPVGNEFIMLLKDSSLVSVIAMTELLRTTRLISSRTATAIIYLPAAAIYLLLTSIFTIVFDRLEAKYSEYE